MNKYFIGADISDGKQLSGDQCIERVGRLGSASSINGILKVDQGGEINPSLFVAEIKNGELVEVK